MQRCAVTFTAGTGSRRFEFGPQTARVSIGRSQQADLYVNSPRLSRTHCAVRLDPQGGVLEDLGSANVDPRPAVLAGDPGVAGEGGEAVADAPLRILEQDPLEPDRRLETREAALLAGLREPLVEQAPEVRPLHGRQPTHTARQARPPRPAGLVPARGAKRTPVVRSREGLAPRRRARPGRPDQGSGSRRRACREPGGEAGATHSSRRKPSSMARPRRDSSTVPSPQSSENHASGPRPGAGARTPRTCRRRSSPSSGAPASSGA